jgi:hypothetical protein
MVSLDVFITEAEIDQAGPPIVQFWLSLLLMGFGTTMTVGVRKTVGRRVNS